MSEPISSHIQGHSDKGTSVGPPPYDGVRVRSPCRAMHGRLADSRSRLADHPYGVLDLPVGEIRTGGQPQA
ncbi:hypothetical protein SY2F82_58980 [Streptomyces sp. Y2F8-2]|nr:hypothetical protein SY2F82_58980 [Streptomyces sp. Y2F8-2]